MTAPLTGSFTFGFFKSNDGQNALRRHHSWSFGNSNTPYTLKQYASSSSYLDLKFPNLREASCMDLGFPNLKEASA